MIVTRILAVETSGDFASAAVYDNGSVVCRLIEEKNRHTETLLSLVDEVLKEAGAKITDVDVVAFGAGPGAFTGLRVACGAAQGLAWAADKPVVQVGNLAAAAFTVFRKNAQVHNVAVVNDARMHECYAAFFEAATDRSPCEKRAPELIKPAMLSDYLTETGALSVAGTALSVYKEEALVPQTVTALTTEPVSAEDIVMLAARMFEEGDVVKPQFAAPLYVRNRVALTITERLAGEKL